MNSHQPGIGQIIAERKGLFTLVFVGFAAAVVAASLLMTPIYEARTVLLVERHPADAKVAFLGAQNPFQPELDINSEYQFLRSRALAETVAETIATDPEFASAACFLAEGEGKPADWLLRHVRIHPLEGSDVVEVVARTTDPQATAEFANAYAAAYVRHARERARTEVERVREFLGEQVSVVRGRLEGAQGDLRDYQERTGTANLRDETGALVEQLATFETACSHAEAELIGQRERLSLLRSQLAKAQEELASRVPIVTVPVINRLRVELADRMAYRERFLAAGYAADHAKIRELERQITEIQDRLIAAIEGAGAGGELPSDPVQRVESLVGQILVVEVEVYALEARANSLRASATEFSKRMNSIPEKSFEMSQLTHKADVDEKILAMLMQRYEEARIEEAGLAGTAQVIDPAIVPERPIRPDLRLNLAFGLLFGGALAAASCALGHRLRRKIQNGAEATAVSGLEVVARVPRLTIRDLPEGALHLRPGPMRRLLLRRKCRRVAEEGPLVHRLSPWAPTAEAYRALRFRLFQSRRDAPTTLLVTSPTLGDGKTTTACNLALVCASTGARVLLVDADLRRPMIGRRFNVEGGHGLADVISGRAPLDRAVVAAPVPGLDLLPCSGAVENPQDLFGSGETLRLFTHLRSLYDIVILDAPPMVPVFDSAVLSTLADATLLVVRPGRTDSECLAHAASIFRSLGTFVEGVVLNSDTKAMGSRRYYDYYGQPKSLPAPRRAALPATASGSGRPRGGRPNRSRAA